MILHRRVNLGGYQSMEFVSSEHAAVQDCARDLVAQMMPLATAYPALKGAAEEIKKAYNV